MNFKLNGSVHGAFRPCSALLGHARPRPADHVTVYQETWREVGTKMVVASYERVDDFSRGSCFPIVRKKCRAAALSSRIRPAEGSAMIYDIKWIIPKLRNPTSLWKIASSITVAAVGIFSKIIIGKRLHEPVFRQKSVPSPAQRWRARLPPIVFNLHSETVPSTVTERINIIAECTLARVIIARSIVDFYCSDWSRMRQNG